MNCTKYRWFLTSSGKLVIGGKNQEQNEEIVNNSKSSDILLHTKEPGSPFVRLDKTANPADLKEAAVFCASFSQGWKKNRKKMEVHIFKKEQICKEKSQKTGSFSVTGKIQKAVVELKLGLLFQQNKLRAVPLSVGNPFIIIMPGSLKKEKIAQEISKILKKDSLEVKEEEIMQALPAGGFKLKCSLI